MFRKSKGSKSYVKMLKEGKLITWAIRDTGVDVAGGRHLKGESGVDRKAERGIGALFDKDTQALGLAALHFLSVLAALLGRLLCSATHIGNASGKVCQLVGALLLVILHARHASHHQHDHHNQAEHHHLLASSHFVFVSCPLSPRRSLAPPSWVCNGIYIFS